MAHVREPGPDPEQLAHRASAAPALREQLRSEVGERKLAVFIALSRGEGYRAVTARFGIGRATAHAWKEEVTHLLGERARLTGGSAGTILHMLRTPMSRPAVPTLPARGGKSAIARSRRAR